MKATISSFTSKGTVVIPPSKSMSHRAIICAALSKGTSMIKNIAWSDDILVTMEGMIALGAQIQKGDDYAVITGVSIFTHTSTDTIFCNESGSTLRFFIPIFSLCNKSITFTGKGRLMERPQTIYEEIFKQQSLTFKQDETGIQIYGSLKPDTFYLRGDISSQFMSGLLFTLPLLQKNSKICIYKPFESRSYIQLTIDMLKHFGVSIHWENDHTLSIPGNQTYHAKDYTIEGDYSQFAFFAVLAAINHDLTIKGIDSTSHQGDKAILDILSACGISVRNTTQSHHISHGIISDLTIDLQDCPDLGPILTILGMYSSGTTQIINAGRLRIKESDRIEAMETELRKLGVDITSSQDTITIHGQRTYEGGVTLQGHNDHRIVMSLAIACSLTKKPCIIEGAEAIRKSYPRFFEDLQSIQGKVVLQDE